MIQSELQAAASMADEAAPVFGPIDRDSGDANGGAAPVRSPAELRGAVRAQMEMNGWSQKAAAKKMGIGESVLSLWLKSAYSGDNAKIDAAAAKWLALQADGETVKHLVPAAPVWVPTPTAKRIVAGLRFAQTFGAVACIHGGAGVGKTRAITWYKKSGTNVFVATATPTEAGLAPCLPMICRAAGIEHREQNLGAGDMMDDICAKLDGTEGLLVVDEAQQLSVKALDQVRSIHDRTGIGLALAGNNQIYANLTGGRRQAHFAQLFSRIGKRVALNRPAPADVEAIARAFGVERRDELEYLKAIGARPGAIRGVVYTLRSAALMAAEEEKPLGLAHLQAAWADLGAEV